MVNLNGRYEMILDLPLHTEQIIHHVASRQGKSVEQFILSIVDEKLSQINLELLAEQNGLNSDVKRIELEPNQYVQLLERLERASKKNAKLQQLLSLTANM